jgi:hypothetical protein
MSSMSGRSGPRISSWNKSQLEVNLLEIEEINYLYFYLCYIWICIIGGEHIAVKMKFDERGKQFTFFSHPRSHALPLTDRLTLELDLRSLFGLRVHSCTHWLRPRNSPLPRHLGSYRGRYWSAKINEISLWPLAPTPPASLRVLCWNFKTIYRG